MPYPGSYFTTIGGKIQSILSEPTTERLLIIGTAVDGPLNRPTRITDAQQAEKIFGPGIYTKGYKDPITGTLSGANNGASIPRAIGQAIAAGCSDIYVVRATGTYATLPSAFSSKLSLKATNPGRIYNEVVMTVANSSTGLAVTLTQPSQKGISFTSYFASSLTVSEVIDRLNGDRRNTCLYINREAYPTYLVSACTTIGSGTATLAGGTNGCQAPGEDYASNLYGYATALTATDTGTFDTLLGLRFRFNVAVMTGLYLDDQVVSGGSATSTTIATDFVLFLDACSTEISPCHGVMGVRPPNLRDDTALINYINNNLLTTTAAAWDATQKWNCAGYFLYTGWVRADPVAGTVDLGKLLSVCAGPECVFSNNDIGRFTDNFHVAYAAMLTTMPPERAPIFKAIPGVTTYGNALPAKYCNKLVEGVGFDQNNDISGKGAYVCLTRNPRDPFGPMVVFDDSTVAARDDYFRNYQLIHLCNSIHGDLDYALSSFIGGPASTATLAAMESQVQNILDGYVSSNALRGARGQGYDFKITMSGTDQALGIVRVFLDLFPATAIRKIYFVVQVKQSNN